MGVLITAAWYWCAALLRRAGVRARHCLRRSSSQCARHSMLVTVCSSQQRLALTLVTAALEGRSTALTKRVRTSWTTTTYGTIPFRCRFCLCSIETSLSTYVSASEYSMLMVSMVFLTLGYSSCTLRSCNYVILFEAF